MAPKKSASSKTPGASLAQSQAKHDQELKDLASKAKKDSFQETTAGQLTVCIKAGALLTLLGIYAEVSQLALSPVYGGIPSSVSHARVIMAGCFLGWAGNLALRQYLPMTTAQLLPVVAVIMPAARFLLDGFSGQLGSWWGPLVVEVATLMPLATVTAACVADQLEGLKLPEALPRSVADSLPGVGSWAGFKLAEHLAGHLLRANVGSSLLYTRFGLEVLLGASYAAMAPSKWLLLAAPALLHTAVLNTHAQTSVATAALNASLTTDNWALLDRKESLTGYLSVIESLDKGFRVLRCDHSILGGQWVFVQGVKVAEPIYGIFAMLEAVRLVESAGKVADEDAKALVIGLGIGTAPSALVAHGIDTTVVEIDPGVHELAVKHFDVLENNPPVFADAVKYTAQLAVDAKESYDYIIHDVFTGGAEPLELFTLEFLESLAAILKPNGVVAINYAGDFALPVPKIIVRTITKVFPTCRIFRESPPDPENIENGGADFTNMVIFCQKTTDPLTFRAAVENDFLQSRVRQVFLEPKNEVEQLDFLGGENEGSGMEILQRSNTGELVKWHQTSAAGHWDIMRMLIPASVWERW